MTVSDWGSAVAPTGASGFQQAFSRHAEAQPGRANPRDPRTLHPAPGGPGPHHAQEMYVRQMSSHGGSLQDGGGYPPHQAYNTPRSYAPAPAPAHADGHWPAAGQDGYAPQAAPRRPGRPDGGAAGPGGSTALNVVGALVSVALVIGLGVWGYRLAVRDVTGVPVVKALEGPMRIQPEDPGGVVAQHQGFSVNDVAGEGISAGPVDQVTLAPPAPELTEEDVPAHPEAEVAAAPQRPATAPLPSASAVVPPANGAEINADAAVAEALGLTDIPGLDAAGFDSPATPAAVPSGLGDEIIPESVPGVTRSPRPLPRPARFDSLPELTAPLAAVDVSAAAAAMPAPARPAAAAAPDLVLGQEIEAGSVDPNARLVQLGAFATPDEARDGWKKIAALNPDLFQHRNWTIERHEAGGTPFYRLRALGFGGLEEARGFCAALVAAQGSCVPVIDRGTDQAAAAVTN